MLNAMPDHSPIPSISIWKSKKNDEFILESCAEDPETWGNVPSGAETVMTASQIKSGGLDYVLRDLESFSERKPAPRPLDVKAAVKNNRERMKNYLFVLVSLQMQDNNRHLRFGSMKAQPNMLGSAGLNEAIKLSFPASQDQFWEALCEAFEKLRA